MQSGVGADTISIPDVGPLMEMGRDNEPDRVRALPCRLLGLLRSDDAVHHGGQVFEIRPDGGESRLPAGRAGRFGPHAPHGAALPESPKYKSPHIDWEYSWAYETYVAGRGSPGAREAQRMGWMQRAARSPPDMCTSKLPRGQQQRVTIARALDTLEDYAGTGPWPHGGPCPITMQEASVPGKIAASPLDS